MVGAAPGAEEIETAAGDKQIGDFFLISEHFNSVHKHLQDSPIVNEVHVDFLEFGREEGRLRGRLLFLNGFRFEFMEYLSGKKEACLSYQ